MKTVLQLLWKRRWGFLGVALLIYGSITDDISSLVIGSTIYLADTIERYLR